MYVSVLVSDQVPEIIPQVSVDVLDLVLSRKQGRHRSWWSFVQTEDAIRQISVVSPDGVVVFLPRTQFVFGIPFFPTVPVTCESQFRIPSELPDEVAAVDGEFDTRALGLAYVGGYSAYFHEGFEITVSEQVLDLLVEIFDRTAKSLVEETEIETKVEFRGGLPLQVRIGKLRLGRTRAHARAEHILLPCGSIIFKGVVPYVAVTRLSEADAQFEIGQGFEIFQEVFLVYSPCKGPGREETVPVVGSEVAGTVHTGGECEEILVHQVVIDPSEVGHQDILRLVGSHIRPCAFTCLK